MATKQHLVYAPEYKSDLSVLGTTVQFAPDRGARVIRQLKSEFRCPIDVRRPRMLTFNQIELTHDHVYIESLKEPAVWADIFGIPTVLPPGKHTSRILRRLFNEYRLKSGGTLLAAQLALRHGLAANLGAGYHHAHRNRGDGYCLINDIAITIHNLRQKNSVKKVMVVDLDFHQGNGVSTIFAGDADTFTLDFHSLEAWPKNKEQCSLAVAIAGNESHLYNQKLKPALAKALSMFQPELVLFLHGADSYEYGLKERGSCFGLTLEQIRERDELVIDTFADRKIPLALVFAGGYGNRAWEAHYQGVRHLLQRAGALPDKINQ
jgi:acetoin utilization deacetylase AcuC-like enzyme